MFKINRATNRIQAVRKPSFSELGFRERDHLQEWLAHEPSALGEELLIIQKEFAGFDGTRERLDLLALDKAGRLVIIENKLDDSGKDVVWQSLKYAAYCSTLDTKQIVSIFRQHIGASTDDDAKEQLVDFLDDQNGEDLALNPTGTQRIFLVAAQFRDEITSTALWLLGRGINITCIQVTPFQSDNDLFLDVSQIIPPPDTEDFMIRLAEKTVSDDKAAHGEVERHKRRRTYWDRLLKVAEERGIGVLANKSSTNDNWMTAKVGKSGIHFAMIITEKEARVQFELVSSRKEINKARFETAKAHRAIIEARLDEPLTWRRMDNAKASRIHLSTPVAFLEKETWGDIIDWHLSRLQQMQIAFAHALEAISSTSES